MLTLRLGFTAALLAAPTLFGQAPASQSAPAVSPERTEPGGVTRIFYVAHAPEVQQFQEMANAVRTVGEIKGVFAYNAGRAIIVRGTAGEAGMAGWLIQAMDQPAGQAPPERPYTASGSDVVRVFQLTNAKAPQEIQEIANAMRNAAEIRRVFVFSAGRMVAVRGTPDDLAMAGWLLAELDKPAASSASIPEYRVPGAGDDILRVYHLLEPPTVQDFQEEINAVRTTTEMRRVFSYNAQRAVAMRGTADQLALAEFVMKGLARNQ